MQRKLTLAWRGGSIAIENNRVAIRQGNNVVYVDMEQFDAFLVDVEAAMNNLPKPEPTAGYGGTVSPIAPKKPKSMEELTQNLLYTARGWKISTK
jgi:hypothetical protein